MRDFGRLDQPWPTICTFHSLCLRVLRHYAEKVGLPPTFSIYDSGDQTKLIKEATKATIRCIPLAGQGPGAERGTCIKSGRASEQRVLFAKNY